MAGCPQALVQICYSCNTNFGSTCKHRLCWICPRWCSLSNLILIQLKQIVWSGIMRYTVLVCYNFWLTMHYFLTDNSVLRVPILYGDIEYLSESPVTILFENILAGKESIASDYEIKYPTHCGDIAYTIRQIADKRLQVSIVYTCNKQAHICAFTPNKVSRKLILHNSLLTDSRKSSWCVPLDIKWKNDKIFNVCCHGKCILPRHKKHNTGQESLQGRTPTLWHTFILCKNGSPCLWKTDTIFRRDKVRFGALR